MSSQDLDDAPSIQQALSEKSIFLLVKRLSRCFQSNVKHNKIKLDVRESKVNSFDHFKVYEKLLQKGHSDIDSGNVDQRLATCISELNLPADPLRELCLHLNKLHQSNPNAKDILQFLLNLTNYQPKQTTRRTSRDYIKQVGIFQCPRELMDGSLFERRPNYGEHEAEDLASKFSFDLLPGSNLKFAGKFFDHYGVPTENKIPATKENDYGYSSPPESVIAFDEVIALGPLSRHRTWECLGRLVPKEEKPFFSEAGVITPTNKPVVEHTVSMQQLQRDLAFLLSGVTSSCFPFSQEEQSFMFAEGLNVAGLTPQVVEKIFSPMLECGRCFRQLEKFTEVSNQDDGLIIKAVRLAVQKFLVLHREASQRLLLRGGSGFSQLLQGMRWLGPPLTAVSSLCCQPQPVQGVLLLEQLCAQTALLPPGRTACVFYSLLKHAAEAYFRILKTWLFDGEIEAESGSEFFVQLQPAILSKRDRRYWTQGFVLLPGRVPGFLQGFEQQILMCGKAVRFLKVCNPKDPLVCEVSSEQPNILCYFQQVELVSLQQQCQKYEASVRVLCGAPVTACSQMEQSSEQKEAFFKMIQQVHNERVKDIKAKQQSQREAAMKKKQRLCEELRQQIDEVRARKVELQKREREEEEEQQRIREAQQAHYDQIKADERAKLNSQYEKDTRDLDVKLRRTQRQIALLNHELSEVLNPPAEPPADVNSNPVTKEIDSNANLPIASLKIISKLPRKIPTSLPLKKPTHLDDMDNANKPGNITACGDTEDSSNTATVQPSLSSLSEAARNKVRILSHEYNLITNYSDEMAARELDNKSKQENAQALTPTLTEIHNLNRSEAARNKSKVLQHELYITNDNDNKGKEENAQSVNKTVNMTEAVRNKNRLLQHELHLITNYNETETKKSPAIKNSIALQIKNKILKEEYGIDNIVETEKVEETRKEIIKTDLGNAYNATQEQAVKNRNRAFEGEWNIIPEENNKDASPTSESMASPNSSSSGDSSAPAETENKPEPSPMTDVPHSNMTVSMTSLKTDAETPSAAFPSAITDIETPSSMCPSAMTGSYDTTSGVHLVSPSSAMMISSSAMTDSKILTETPMSDIAPKIPASASASSFLSALSMLSEPFKWSVNHDKEAISSTVKSLNISTSQVSHALRQTISTVSNVQLKLVNQSVLKLLLKDEQLLEHLSSLRQYFLLLDGEFARNITEKLCIRIEENRQNPTSLLNFVSLDSILNHALASSVHGCRDPNAAKLSLGKRFDVTEFHLYAPNTLNCVELQYQVPWPLNMVLNPESLDCYDKIFNFLLGLRRAGWAMDKSFQLLQESYSSMDLKRCPQYHQLRLFRNDMACFIQAFLSYIMNIAVLQCWKNNEKIFKTAKTLDDLYKIHAKFLKQVIFYCLLKKNAEPVQTVLQSVLKSVLKFYKHLSTYSWCKVNGEYSHPAFKLLTETYKQYKARTQLFLRHMTKIASRGHQTELFELLHVLNMNDFYGLKL